MLDVSCNDPVLDAIGWYCGNAGGAPNEVGSKPANAWGLFDMHGNLYEWCNDWYDVYPGAVTDPKGPMVDSSAGSDRVLRGGNFFSYAPNCRSANRYNYNPDYSYLHFGFRVAKSAE